MGALECIDVLLKRGADPNTKDLMGVHALYHAARNGYMVLTFLHATQVLYVPNTNCTINHTFVY